MSGLADRAVTIHVCVRQWSGRKLDKGAGDELAKMKHAEAGDAIRTYKRLVKSEHLEKFRSCGGKIRGLLYDRTMPWDDNGTRICPNVTYEALMADLGKIVEDADKAAEDFVHKDYEPARQRARQELGELFNDKDYPDVRVMRRKFAIEPKVRPLPNPDKDWRTNFKADPLADLSQAVDLEVFRRLATCVTKLLRQVDQRGKPLTKKHLEAVDELVQTLPALNITDNKDVAQLLLSLKKDLVGFDKKAFKAEPTYAAEIVKKVTATQSKAAKFFADLGGELDVPEDVDDDDDDKPATKVQAKKPEPKAKPVAKKAEPKKAPAKAAPKVSPKKAALKGNSKSPTKKPAANKKASLVKDAAVAVGAEADAIADVIPEHLQS